MKLIKILAPLFLFLLYASNQEAMLSKSEPIGRVLLSPSTWSTLAKQSATIHARPALPASKIQQLAAYSTFSNKPLFRQMATNLKQLGTLRTISFKKHEALNLSYWLIGLVIIAGKGINDYFYPQDIRDFISYPAEWHNDHKGWSRKFAIMHMEDLIKHRNGGIVHAKSYFIHALQNGILSPDDIFLHGNFFSSLILITLDPSYSEWGSNHTLDLFKDLSDVNAYTAQRLLATILYVDKVLDRDDQNIAIKKHDRSKAQTIADALFYIAQKGQSPELMHKLAKSTWGSFLHAPAK